MKADNGTKLKEACFYATEALCVLHWGRASDRFGRKPILISGLMGLSISTIGFGLSTQFWSAVLARCAEGALCGNIGMYFVRNDASPSLRMKPRGGQDNDRRDDRFKQYRSRCAVHELIVPLRTF